MKSAWQAEREADLYFSLDMSLRSGRPAKFRKTKDNCKIIAGEINSAISRGERHVWVSTGLLRFRGNKPRGEQIGPIVRRLISLGYGVSFHASPSSSNPMLRIYWKTQV